MSSKHTLACLLAATLSLSGCGGSAASPVATQALTPETPGSPVLPQRPLAPPRASRDLIQVLDDQPIQQNLLENDLARGGKVTSFDPGPAAGRVSISPEGLLSYTPIPGGAPYSETFTYTLQNEDGSSTASVTAQSQTKIYVNNQAAAGGNGSSGKPFNNLQAALDLAGSNPALIVVSPGDFTVTGLSIPLVTLVPGQSIMGTDSQSPPNFFCQFNLPLYGCSLTNMHILGANNGPMVTVQGAEPPDNYQELVLKNVIFDTNTGDGLKLINAAGAQLTNLLFLNMNRAGGTGALVIETPTGNVNCSNIDLRGDAVAGIVVQSGTFPPGFGGPVPITVNGLSLESIANPVLVQATGGYGTLTVSGVTCTTNDLSGTLFGGTVSGTAQYDAQFENVDLRGIGLNTQALNWSYQDNSLGTVRWGAMTNQVPLFTPAPLNPLTFNTSGSANAAWVSYGTSLSLGNPATLTASENSTMAVRYDNYGWTPNFATSERPTFSMLTHDNAVMNCRVLFWDNNQFNSPDGKLLPNFSWTSDRFATTRIERLSYNDFGSDNPQYQATWNGWFDINENENEWVQFTHHMASNVPVIQSSFDDAETGTLNIPQY